MKGFLNPDDVERLGVDITDEMIGQALTANTVERDYDSTDKHIVALYRDGKTLTAIDVTSQSDRDQFFQDIQEDTKDGLEMNNTRNYRLFLLPDDKFRECIGQ